MDFVSELQVESNFYLSILALHIVAAEGENIHSSPSENHMVAV